MLSRFKIGTRIAAGFAAVLVLVLVVAVAGLWGNARMTASAERNSQTESRAQQARSLTLQLRRFEKDFLLTTGDAKAQASYVEKWTTALAELRSDLEGLAALVERDDQAVIGEMAAA